MGKDRQDIINQIAYLINYRKESVIELLKNSNIPINDVSEESIANVIMDNIYDNENLQGGFDKLIEENNEHFSEFIANQK